MGRGARLLVDRNRGDPPGSMERENARLKKWSSPPLNHTVPLARFDDATCTAYCSPTPNKEQLRRITIAVKQKRDAIAQETAVGGPS